VSLPGWELAASAYATTLQPDYDADWADDATVIAAVRASSRSYEANAAPPSRPLVPPSPEVTRRGGPPAPTKIFAEAEAEPSRAPSRERAPLWTPADAVRPPTGPDAQIPWRRLITVLVLALLAGGAYVAAPRVHDWWVARAVPGELRAYIGGDGVSVSPVGEGYSARLPKAPVHAAAPRSSLSAPWIAIHKSVVTGADYQIVVRVAQLSRGGELPFGAAGALGDPRIVGDVAATDIRAVTFAGQPAFDFEGSQVRPLHGRTFLRGARLYVVTVESDGADRVFDELMRSFTPAAA
jgi:hypothetical protein